MKPSLVLKDCLLKTDKEISIINEKLKFQAKKWYDFFENKEVKCLVENSKVRSDTVITIEGTEEEIKQIKAFTKAHGITVGNGYGSWKNTTFRIANFPAIEDFEIESIMTILSQLTTYRLET